MEGISYVFSEWTKIGELFCGFAYLIIFIFRILMPLYLGL